MIARATAKDPSQRFDDVVELAPRSARRSRDTRRPWTDGELRNPYKGLRAFLEADALDFFGREAVIERLVGRLGETSGRRFLAVVGPSGAASRPSSAPVSCRPSGAARSRVRSGGSWSRCARAPTLLEIEAACSESPRNPRRRFMEELERDELGLARAVQRVLPDPDAELVLVIDQLEELFTLVDGEAERATCSVPPRPPDPAPGPRRPTLRADFFDGPFLAGFGTCSRLGTRRHAAVPRGARARDRRPRPSASA